MPWRRAQRHSHKKSRKRTAMPWKFRGACQEVLTAFNCCKNEAARGEVKISRKT
jgi:hypothetical protein